MYLYLCNQKLTQIYYNLKDQDEYKINSNLREKKVQTDLAQISLLQEPGQFQSSFARHQAKKLLGDLC